MLCLRSSREAGQMAIKCSEDMTEKQQGNTERGLICNNFNKISRVYVKQGQWCMSKVAAMPLL